MLNTNPLFSPAGGRSDRNWQRLVCLVVCLGPALYCPSRAISASGSQSCLGVDPSLTIDDSTQGKVACCQPHLLHGSFTDAPEQGLPELCRLLLLPTDSRSDADRFRRLVDPNSIARHSSPSPAGTTWPSLWWNQDSIPVQLGGYALVDAWVTYRLQSSPVQVMDLMVNSQIWGGLTLSEHYGVLRGFGDAAQQFGYQLRLFESNGYTANLVGLYACLAGSSPDQISCHVSLDTIRLGQLQQGAASDAAGRVQNP